MGVKLWSEEEVEFLKANYNEMTDKEIGEKLGRTIASVRGKRQRVNLKKENPQRLSRIPMPPKKELERLYLRENLTPSEIARKKKVSANTVRTWLKRKGIPVKRPYTSYVETGLSDSEKAYLAGYLDGDGTITATLDHSTPNRRRRGYGVHYEVSLITKHKSFVEKLNDMVGGYIHTFIYEDSREKKKGYKLSFGNQASALAFLKAVVPHLILKKKQAELMIAFLENRLKARREKGNGAIISNESWKLIEEIRRLNS